MTGRLQNFALLVTLASLARFLVGQVSAELDLTASVSQICTPLNVSWTPQADAYPYTVWVVGFRGSVEAYRINSDYQPGAKELTFQYVVPPPAIGFQTYTVVVADDKGNGNTTRPLSIAMPSNSARNCDPFTATPAWTWAGDATVGTMTQCGIVRFYNIDNRGTRPFTISWVPIQGEPVTVEVPNSATLNNSAFIYNSNVPFEEGTQFNIVLGDATGAFSGGSSELYTTGPSDNSSCLDPSYTLPNALRGKSLPAASQIATFRNLAGAINATSSGSGGGGGGGSNVEAIAGGAIGGAIAVGIVIGCLVMYLLYKRRQKSKKEEARKEDSHFVDLDGDEDENAGAAALNASRRSRYQRNDGGVQQTYSVSPFTYQPTSNENIEASNAHEMANRTSRPGSFGGSTQSPDGSYGDLLAAAGMARVPSSNQSAVRPASSHSFGSASGLLPGSPGTPIPPVPTAPFAYQQHSRVDSHSSNYRLHTTNDDAAASAQTANDPSNSQAGPLPRKAPLLGDSETQNSANPNRRVVMHSDGGPLPQPESDDEEALEELPPQYGGWTQNGGTNLNRGASTSRRPLE